VLRKWREEAAVCGKDPRPERGRAEEKAERKGAATEEESTKRALRNRTERKGRPKAEIKRGYLLLRQIGKKGSQKKQAKIEKGGNGKKKQKRKRHVQREGHSNSKVLPILKAKTLRPFWTRTSEGIQKGVIRTLQGRSTSLRRNLTRGRCWSGRKDSAKTLTTSVDLLRKEGSGGPKKKALNSKKPHAGGVTKQNRYGKRDNDSPGLKEYKARNGGEGGHSIHWEETKHAATREEERAKNE